MGKQLYFESKVRPLAYYLRMGSTLGQAHVVIYMESSLNKTQDKEAIDSALAALGKMAGSASVNQICFPPARLGSLLDFIKTNFK